MPKLEQYLELCSGAFDFKELFLEDDESLKVIQVCAAYYTGTYSSTCRRSSNLRVGICFHIFVLFIFVLVFVYCSLRRGQIAN